MSRGDGLARLREALEEHGSAIRGTSAQCPAHDDREASLSIGQGRDRALVNCHAGCAKLDILAALGLSWADLGDEPRKGNGRGYEVTATYTYTDEAGNPLFYAERRMPKDFRQYHIRNGRKVWKLPARRVLYQLPKVIEAVASGQTIYVVEGEKDVHAIEAAGGVATCNPMGAGKWRPEYGDLLKGANVIVVADKDPAGYAHAAVIKADLTGKAASVTALEAATGKDAADHLAAGHGLDDFRQVQAEPGPADLSGAQVVRLSDVEPERVTWLWDGYLPLGKLVTLDGDPGVGKSTVTIDIGARVSTGSPMPDGTVPVKGAVLILSAEDGLADTIRPRLDAAGANSGQVITITGITGYSDDGEPYSRPISIPGDLRTIEQVIRDNRVVLVIVDVLMAFLSGDVNSHRDQDVRRALHVLATMAERCGCCVFVLRHLNKSGGGNAMYRGGGSIGIIGAARAGFMCGADPDDDSGQARVFACVKSNLAAEPPALAYRLVPDGLRGCARVQWEGISDHGASSLLTEPAGDEERDDRTERNEAAEWLTGYLTDNGGEATPGDAKKAAREAGIATRTLERARVKAHVKLSRSGFPARTTWALDLSVSPQSRQPRQSPNAGEHGEPGGETTAASKPSDD